MNRQRKVRTLTVLGAGGMMMLAGPASALAVPMPGSASLLGVTVLVPGVSAPAPGGFPTSILPVLAAPVTVAVPTVPTLLGTSAPGAVSPAMVVVIDTTSPGASSASPPASPIAGLGGAPSPPQLGGPGRLVIRGARLVRHGTRVRVTVSCIGKPSQACSGVLKISRPNKLVARSAMLHMRGQETKKILLKLRGHHRRTISIKGKPHHR